MLIITPMLLAEMGGWSAVAARIPEERFHLYPRDAGASGWFAYARDWLVIGLGNLAGQDLVQRSLSSRDEQVAYRSAYLAGLIYVTIGLLPVLLGMAGSVILPGLAVPDLVMMELASRYLPEAALVLFAGALVSALLSSADSALLAPASVIGWDVLRFFNPKASEKTSLRIARLSVLLLGVISLALALHRTSVYDLMVDSWSVLLATLFVPLTGGLWWPRANAAGALAAIVVGLASWLLFIVLLPQLPGDLLAVPFAAAALVAGSFYGSQPPAPVDRCRGPRPPSGKPVGMALRGIRSNPQSGNTGNGPVIAGTKPPRKIHKAVPRLADSRHTQKEESPYTCLAGHTRFIPAPGRQPYPLRQPCCH